MAPKEYPENKHFKALRKIAMSQPDASEAPSCKNRAFSSGKKNFLFLGMKEDHYIIRLKVKDSVDDVLAMAEAEPGKYEINPKMGWCKIILDNAEAPPKQIKAWILESFSLIVPGAAAAKKTTKKTATKKKAAKKK